MMQHQMSRVCVACNAYLSLAVKS